MRSQTRVSARAIADHLLRKYDSRRLSHLDDAIVESVQSLNPDLSPLEAAEQAERDIAEVARELEKIIAERKERNRYVAFDLINHSMLRGLDYAPLPTAKSSQFRMSDLAAGIRSLSPIEFERFCVLIAHYAGIRSVLQTRQSRDGGVDMYGFFPLSFRPLFDVRLGVCIEAKSERVTMRDYRAFLGASDIALANTRTQRGDHRFDLRSREPVLLAMFTARQVTADVHRQAQKDGVLVFEADHLAALVWDHVDRNVDSSTAVRRLLGD